MKYIEEFYFVSLTGNFMLSMMVDVNLGCQVQFYDIPGRRFHISKAYDQVTRSRGDCRDRCALDNDCLAFMHYNTTNLCALSNISYLHFGYLCDYCFSAKRGNCIEPTTTTTTRTITMTESASTLCTCTCDEDSTVDNITKLNERISSLKLVKSTLSMSRRKLASADDQRPSAIGVGGVGVFVIITFMTVIVFFDVLKFGFCKK